WTRSVSTTWSGTGDIALFYRENSAPAPSGLVITVRASAPAYLQEVVAAYRGVATVEALDQALVAPGAGTYASVGPTASDPSTAASTTTTTSSTIKGMTTTTTVGPTTTSTTETSTTTTRPRTTTTSTTTPAGTCSGACPIRTVFLILMENYAWSSIKSSPSAP